MATRAKGVFLGSTDVPASKSAAEILALLVRKGATQIVNDYSAGRLTGMRFVFAGAAYSLPVRTEKLYKRIARQKSGSSADKQRRDQEQAERIAWRQLLAWTKAQLAMIDLEMTEPAEVFLPYMIAGSKSETVYEMYQANGNKLLAAGGGK
jgi:hypothetical protein